LQGGRVDVSRNTGVCKVRSSLIISVISNQRLVVRRNKGGCKAGVLWWGGW